MSTTEKHPTTNWYKLFSLIFCLIFVLFAWLQINCASVFAGAAFYEDIIKNATCIIYGILVFFTFLIGMLPVLLGFEHTKKKNIPNTFFKVIVVVYALGLIALIFV